MRRTIWLAVSCPHCGKARVLREHVVVMITMDEQTYAFSCPHCRNVIERNASPKVLEVLLDTIVFDLPPITELEVWQFTEALRNTPDPLAELGG